MLNRHRFIWISGAVSSLLIGGLIYLLSSQLHTFDWLQHRLPFVSEGVTWLKQTLPTLQASSMLVAHGPDLLWSFSLCAIISGIWHRHLSKAMLRLMAVVLSVSFEIAQAFDMVRGTYDTVDLVMSLLAGLLAVEYSVYLLQKARVQQEREDKHGF